MKFNFCPACASPLTVRCTEDGERQVCSDESCGFVHYDNPTPVVAAIVQRGEEVILVRAKGWPETWFGLVTGFLERGESPEQGIVREVGEELSLQAHDPELVGVYPFHHMNQVIIAYHVTVDGDVALSDELVAHKCVPVAKLKPWPFGTGEAVRDWLSRQSL